MDKEASDEVSCEYWSNPKFFECAKDVLKIEILKMGFKCHTVWWKEYFPPDSKECTEDELTEVIRFR